MPRRTPPELWIELKPLVKEKRSLQTDAEMVLWEALRGHRFSGRKFRRQHAIGRFIVDFYCSKARLVVEVDGPIHDYSRVKDKERETFLKSLGLRVVRFSNDTVLGDTKRVLAEIHEALENSPPAAASPSPPGGEGD